MKAVTNGIELLYKIHKRKIMQIKEKKQFYFTHFFLNNSSRDISVRMHDPFLSHMGLRKYQMTPNTHQHDTDKVSIHHVIVTDILSMQYKLNNNNSQMKQEF